MKDLRVISLVLACSLLICNVVGCNKEVPDKIEDKEVPENVVSKVEESNNKVVEYTENRVNQNKDNNNVNMEKDGLNVKGIYKNEINKLINKYGKFYSEQQWYPISGLKYAELIKFDEDEIPEMLVIHDMKVLLYTIKDGKVILVYEDDIGGRYSQSDVAYTIGINTYSEKTSLIVYKTEQCWQEESIKIVSLEQGVPIFKRLYAKTKPNNELPNRENLISFSIDDEVTTEDEYYKVYDNIVKPARSIDVCWDLEPASKANLEAFIQALK